MGISLVAQMVKRLPTVRETRVQSLGWEDRLEKEMATHSSILAWKIPWTKEPGRLESVGSQRVRHDWATFFHFHVSYDHLYIPSLSFSNTYKLWMQYTSFIFNVCFIPHLEKAMAPHSSVLAWRIPAVWEPGGLLSMGSHRVGHDWSDLAAAYFIYAA